RHTSYLEFLKLYLLIDNIGLIPLNNLEKPSSNNKLLRNSHEQVLNEYNEFLNNSQKQVIANNNCKQVLSKRTNSAILSQPSVFTPFCSPLKASSKVNLPSHLEKSHSEPPNLGPSHSGPSYSGLLHSELSYSAAETLKNKYDQVCDQEPELNNSNTVIKNYYNINAKYVKIIKK
ncbi:341_t:CDS:2, partial [Dentiscutata heterogama]